MSFFDHPRVKVFYNRGIELVDYYVNSNDKVKRSYSFHIRSDKKVREVMKRFCYGYCDYRSREIVLNAEHVINCPIEDVFDTILHEFAHAVCFAETGHRGHGKKWRRVARRFGCTDRATSKLSGTLYEKLKNESKYIMVIKHDNHLEEAGYYKRRLKDLDRRWVNGRKETKGKLWLLPTEVYKEHGLTVNKVEHHLIR